MNLMIHDWSIFITLIIKYKEDMRLIYESYDYNKLC